LGLEPLERRLCGPIFGVALADCCVFKLAISYDREPNVHTFSTKLDLNGMYIDRRRLYVVAITLTKYENLAVVTG
jgi:hypothetical protein